MIARMSMLFALLALARSIPMPMHHEAEALKAENEARLKTLAEHMYPRTMRLISKIKEKAARFEVKAKILISLFQMLQGIGFHGHSNQTPHAHMKAFT